MADVRKVRIGVTDESITSMDDVPGVARLAVRQQFLKKWYRILALAPFAVLISISFKFFPHSNNGILVVSILASLIWAIAVAAYAIYLLVAVRCPACKRRFGMGETCRSCSLPRHRNLSRLSAETHPAPDRGKG